MPAPYCDRGMSVERLRERGRGECGLTFSPARGVVCSKRGGIREVSVENKKTNFFTASEAAQLGRRDDYGQRYTVDFLLEWRGRGAMIRSTWIIEHDADAPRLTTCYPL
jgi:uncharacterized protein DUF6883